MSTFVSVIIVVVFGYLIYRYIPKGAERAFRLERFHPRSPMSDWPSSYYDEQRRYADLTAIYGRRDAPDAPLSSMWEADDTESKAAPARPTMTPIHRKAS
ncbi:hypothetical protein [Nocardia iowensis]|uniref:Uncharacterized protein n=1 Tax=Nocardia iowensis TaxID=204891 RepID=A0ABX8RNS3_NOCIO|nr:hypothetical protein [Nocardia iowensis]QXN91284.1 hypothetical protein KV110_39210 [Nocardia iowensis]